ncbi:CsgE family curli-type amyloid fiber assembly protein [Rhodohalobacter sp. 8-1]|uniref:CsgE family curli-type amyloid fiber assembly protein n=1 Tax=Rhodohalobacter sp. 8-1 TaxID=3131972 RepID=UPI0030EC9DF8
MNFIRLIIFTATLALVGISAMAQAAADTASIYIKQSTGDNAVLPENRTEFNERPALTQNNIRSISLYYSDQDEWITISSHEDLQWGTNDLIGDSEFGLEGDSLANNGDTPPIRLAELLSSMVRNRGNVAGDEGREVSNTPMSADDEAMNAFRKAFEAVMQEENEVNPETESEDSVELPEMYGNVAGIVLDETRSKTGRDFYNAFYEAWSKWKGVENSVVRVAEKPGPGLGSIVYVEVNYEEIFELRLRPGDQRTKQAGDVAAARTLSYLKENSNKTLTY